MIAFAFAQLAAEMRAIAQARRRGLPFGQPPESTWNGAPRCTCPSLRWLCDYCPDLIGNIAVAIANC
jgi:hypothetical protein